MQDGVRRKQQRGNACMELGLVWLIGIVAAGSTNQQGFTVIRCTQMLEHGPDSVPGGVHCKRHTSQISVMN